MTVVTVVTAVVSAGAATLLVLLPTTPSAAAAAATCDGKAATIVASSGAVVGTPGDDVILASGRTTIDAGAGNDTVCLVGITQDVDAGTGDDLVDGSRLAEGEFVSADLGPGSDTFVGGAESDSVDSGAGPDRDVIATGDGRDFVTVESATSDVATGQGRDRVTLDAGVLAGGSLALGRATDSLVVHDGGGDVDADLRHRSLVVDDAAYDLVGAEHVSATAHRVHLTGDRHDNVLDSYGCAQRVAAGSGDDRVKLAGDRDPSGCEDVRGQGFGGPGDDVLRSNRGDTGLIGGPGFDLAVGDGRGGTACHAERQRDCVRRRWAATIGP